MTGPSIVLYHRDAAGRDALARALGEFGRVEHAESFPHAVELLALSAAACVLVDLPEDRRARAALAQAAAAYPHTKLFVLAGDLPFDAVRELVRAGVCDVLRVPIDAPACAASVREALAEAAAVPDRLRGMSVAVTSGKGGAGCTALALNLGAALASQGGALVVDADAPPFGTLAVAGDLEIGGTVADVLRQRLPIDPRVLRQSAAQHPAGFTVLSLWALPDDPSEVEGMVAAVVDACTAIAAFVVVDVGRPVLAAQRLLVRRASLVLGVTTLELAALRSLRALIDALADGAGGPTPTLVLNRTDREASYTTEQAAAAIGRPFAAVLPHAAALRGRADRGELAVAADPEDPWSASVRRLAQTIVARRRDAVRSALGDAGARDDG
ncbi:MAG TPA: hypothetical protein VK587_07680 [bacterium]|nr:hypothetical protein [bacterium]